jgi:hypothetical protein
MARTRVLAATVLWLTTALAVAAQTTNVINGGDRQQVIEELMRLSREHEAAEEPFIRRAAALLRDGRTSAARTALEKGESVWVGPGRIGQCLLLIDLLQGDWLGALHRLDRDWPNEPSGEVLFLYERQFALAMLDRPSAETQATLYKRVVEIYGTDGTAVEDLVEPTKANALACLAITVSRFTIWRDLKPEFDMSEWMLRRGWEANRRHPILNFEMASNFIDAGNKDRARQHLQTARRRATGDFLERIDRRLAWLDS